MDPGQDFIVSNVGWSQEEIYEKILGLQDDLVQEWISQGIRRGTGVSYDVAADWFDVAPEFLQRAAEKPMKIPQLRRLTHPRSALCSGRK